MCSDSALHLTWVSAERDVAGDEPTPLHSTGCPRDSGALARLNRVGMVALREGRRC